MSIWSWPIVPLCDKQLRDIDLHDVIYHVASETPLYRTCSIDTAGGGYDKFRFIFQERFGVDTGNRHFIAQVHGCTLECPWCYVTQKGIWGTPVEVTTKQLITAFVESQSQVFHLMGGAPALYLQHWWRFFDKLLFEWKSQKPMAFHSDFLLNEGLYDERVLGDLAACSKRRDIQQLHAVSIKPFQLRITPLQLENLKRLYASSIPFYITFTGMTTKDADTAITHILDNTDLPDTIFKDSFHIPLKHYKALETNTLESCKALEADTKLIRYTGSKESMTHIIETIQEILKPTKINVANTYEGPYICFDKNDGLLRITLLPNHWALIAPDGVRLLTYSQVIDITHEYDTLTLEKGPF